MDISNILSTTQNSQTNQSQSHAGKSQIGKEGFLQLLVAQMRNQDPINPMNGQEFAAQLAQFNSVEQLINLNKGITGLAQSQDMMSQGLSNTMAASLTGKSIRAVSDRISVKANEESTINFKLNNTATKAIVKILDSAGNVVRTEELENLGSGNHTWTWDGKSNAGSRVPEGEYTVEIDAKNGDDPVGALTYQQGIAEKIRYTENGVRLIVNGVAIPLGNVEEIGV